MASVLAVAAVALFLAGVAVGVLVVVAREIRRKIAITPGRRGAEPDVKGYAQADRLRPQDLYMTVLTAGRRAAA